MDIVNSSRFQGYTYFIKKGVEEDLLFLETEKRLFSKKIGRGTIIEKKLVVVKKMEYWI